MNIPIILQGYKDSSVLQKADGLEHSIHTIYS